MRENCKDSQTVGWTLANGLTARGRNTNQMIPLGGFPLIWEQLNGQGSCLWASEIEEFPMAVTTTYFENE